MSSQRWLRNGIAATACALPLLFGGCAAPGSAGVIAGTSTPTVAAPIEIRTSGPTATATPPTPTAIPTEAPTKTPIPPTAVPQPTPTEMPKPTPTVEVSKAPQVDGLTLKQNAQTGISEYFTPEGVYAGKFIPNAVKIEGTASIGIIAISSLKEIERLTIQANTPEKVSKGEWKIPLPIIFSNKIQEGPIEINENIHSSGIHEIYMRNISPSTKFISPFPQNTKDPQINTKAALYKGQGFNAIGIMFPDFMSPEVGVNWSIQILFAKGTTSMVNTLQPISLGQEILSDVSGTIPSPPLSNNQTQIVLDGATKNGGGNLGLKNLIMFNGSPVFFGEPATK